MVGFEVAAEGEGVTFLCPAHAVPITPEEASAVILGQLREDAEQRTGTLVHSAVITVPAYFNDEQRQTTLNAAAIAGIPSATLLSEPVAACLAYGLSGATGRVLVFDLGAGTFDVPSPPLLPHVSITLTSPLSQSPSHVPVAIAHPPQPRTHLPRATTTHPLPLTNPTTQALPLTPYPYSPRH